MTDAYLTLCFSLSNEQNFMISHDHCELSVAVYIQCIISPADI